MTKAEKAAKEAGLVAAYELRKDLRVGDEALFRTPNGGVQPWMWLGTSWKLSVRK